MSTKRQDSVNFFYQWLFVGCLVALVVGCATPESRIKKNPQLFESFPEEVQEKVKQGLIEPGYTYDMVKIALGEPNRRYIRKTMTGMTEVWSYTAFYTTTDRQRLPASFHYRDSAGTIRSGTDTVWVDVQQKNEYEKLRIEFEDGKIKAIESIEK